MGTTSKIVFGSVLILSVTLMFLIFSMQKSAQLTLDAEKLKEISQSKEQKIQAIQKNLETARAEAEKIKAESAVIPELQHSIDAAEKAKQDYARQLEELQEQLKKVAALEEEYRQQQHLLAETEQAKSSTEAQVADIQKKHSEVQDILAQRDEQVVQLENDLAQKDRVIQIYKEKLEGSSEQITLLQTENSSDRLNLNVVLDELAVKSKIIEELIQRIVLLGGTSGPVPSAEENLIAEKLAADARDRALLDKLSLENDSLANTIKEQETLIEELRQEIQEREANLVTGKGEIEALQQSGVSQEEELNELRLAVEESNQTIDRLEASLAEKESEVQAAQAQTTAATVPLSEEVTKLEQQLSEETAKNVELSKNLSQAEIVLESLREEKQQLMEKLEPSQSSLEKAELMIVELEESLTAAETAVQEESAARQAIEGEVGPIKLALSESEEKYETLNNQYLKMEEEFAGLTTAGEEQADLNLQLTDVQTAFAAALQQNSQIINERETLKNEFKAASASISEKENTIQDLSAQLNTVQTELAQVQAAAQQSKEELVSKEQVAEMELRIASLIEEVAAAKGLAETHSVALQSRESELAALKKKSTVTANLEEDNRELQVVIAQHQDQLESSRNEIETLQDSMRALEEERDRLLLYTRDSDTDGVSDAEDECPDTLEGVKVNRQGCEVDSDQDGLVDRLDLCPGTAAGSAPDNTGCSTEQNTVVLQGVSFQLGTSELTANAQSALSHAAIILRNNTDVIMEVAGHTDSIGEPETNLRLSTVRAQAVLDYLVAQGVAEGQLQAKGYGSEEPIAENTTESGRAKNRRVELRRITTEEKAEVEVEEPAEVITEEAAEEPVEEPAEVVE